MALVTILFFCQRKWASTLSATCIAARLLMGKKNSLPMLFFDRFRQKRIFLLHNSHPVISDRLIVFDCIKSNLSLFPALVVAIAHQTIAVHFACSIHSELERIRLAVIRHIHPGIHCTPRVTVPNSTHSRTRLRTRALIPLT